MERISKERVKEIADEYEHGAEIGTALRQLLAYRESGALEALKDLLFVIELPRKWGPIQTRAFNAATAKVEAAISKLEAIEK